MSRGAAGGLLTVLLFSVSACGAEGAGTPAGDSVEPTPALTPEEQNEADARAAINASARVLAAIERGDSALMRESFAPEAIVIATGLEGAVDTTDVQYWVEMVEANRGRFVERIWDPSIELSLDGAVVSAAYDFYTDGEFSHCGTDVFRVVRREGELKVTQLEFNRLQPPECEMHPAGPPPSAGG